MQHSHMADRMHRDMTGPLGQPVAGERGPAGDAGQGSHPLATAPGPMAPRRHAWIWLMFIVLFEVLLVLGAGEIIASFFLPPGQHYIHPQMIMEPHAGRIYYHRPNQQAYTVDQPFVTNSLGFREDQELPLGKDGERRILALGDSVTAGLGVAGPDTYTSQLGALLAGRETPLRVINAGVSCYGTWQEVDVLKETGAVVQPDIVTIQFLWNDLYPKPAEVIPISRERSGDQQDATQKYLRLFKRSRLFLFVRERWSSLVNGRWPSFDWAHRGMILNGESNAYLEQAYHDVGVSLRELTALQGGEFVPVLLIVPIPMQVQQPDAPPTHFQRRIKELADQAGLRTLDLLPALRQAYAENPDIYIAWDYEHFTRRGHRVIAETLERYLVSEGLIPAAHPGVRDTVASAAAH